MSGRLIRFTVARGNYLHHQKGATFDLLEGSEAAREAMAAVRLGRLTWKAIAGHVQRAPRGRGETPHGGIARHLVAIFATLEGALRGAVEAASKLPRDEQEQLGQLLRDNRGVLDAHLANLPLMEATDKPLALPAQPEPRPDRRNPRNVVSPEKARELGVVEVFPTPPEEASARAALEAARVEGEVQLRQRVLHQPPAPARAPEPAPDEGGKPRASNPLPKGLDEMSQPEAVAALKGALASPDDYTTSVLILLGKKAGLPMPGLSGKKKDVVVGALRDLLLGEEEEAAGAAPAATPSTEQPPPTSAAESGETP